MPGGFLIFELVLQAFEIVAHGGGLFKVLILDCLFLFGADLGDLGFELFELGRRGESLDTQARTGFIDQVDGLVGQATVLNVPGRQFGGGLDGTVGDGHAMVVFVAFAQSLEDFDGFGDGRLVHLNRLESTFQRGVLFDVLAVFVGGGGANGLEFASGEHRLEHVGCAERAVRGTCADDCVDLVDEQHDVATALDFLEHFLETLFEVAAVA